MPLPLFIFAAIVATAYATRIERRAAAEHAATVAAMNAGLAKREQERLERLWGGARRRANDRAKAWMLN